MSFFYSQPIGGLEMIIQKRFTRLLMATFLSLTLVGCGGGGGDSSSDSGSSASPSATVSNLCVALDEKDVDQAIEMFDESVQDKYRDILNQAKDHWPEIAKELRDNSEEVYVKESEGGGVAKYKITRIENGDEMVSYILLMKFYNEWKIVTF
jgi:hypothetical protein